MRFLLLLVAAGTVGASFAQTPEAVRIRLWDRNEPVVCILDHVPPGETAPPVEPGRTPTIEEVYGPGMREGDLARLAGKPGEPGGAPVDIAVGANISFSISYIDGPGEGFFHPSFGTARRTAFQAALSKWEGLIQGPASVSVQAEFNLKGGSATAYNIASAGPGQFHKNFTNAPNTNVFYPEALVEIISGNDPDTNTFDIRCDFNGSIDEDSTVAVGVNFYYGTDSNPPGNDIDFITIVQHEFAHGLGFTSSFDTTGAFGLGSNNDPNIFDTHIVNGAGQNLINLAVNPTNVANNNVFFEGPSAVWAWVTDAGQTGDIPLWAPNPYNPGSSISHWDELVMPDWYELQTPNYDDPHDVIDSVLVWAMGDLGYSLPNSRYASKNAGSFRDGSRANPYLTVWGAAESGANRVPTGGTVRIAPGTYAETFILDRAMLLRNYAGDAIIGAGAGPITAAPLATGGRDEAIGDDPSEE
jgi:hypothetical protein